LDISLFAAAKFFERIIQGPVEALDLRGRVIRPRLPVLGICIALVEGTPQDAFEKCVSTRASFGKSKMGTCLITIEVFQ
jgi:hypothetical protein